MNLFSTILYIVCPIEMIERIILAKKKLNFVVMMMIQIKKCTEEKEFDRDTLSTDILALMEKEKYPVVNCIISEDGCKRN